MLAAGRGRRFDLVSRALPKCLLPILDRPLLAWQMAALRELGVRDVVLVVGHLQQRIRAALESGLAQGLRVTCVEQEEPLGIAHALACAAPLLTRPFLCLLGDVFFEAVDLARLVRAFDPGTDAALGVRAGEEARELARNYAVALDPQGWVSSLVEKPSGGHESGALRGVGLYAFRPDFLATARATPASALRGERELTDAIQRHVEGGARVRGVPFEGRDFNLSEPADLLDANLHALQLAGAARWIAPHARVEDGARIERSVVLEHARVARGARLERTLVLAGESVPGGDYRDVVFAGGEVVPCPGLRPGAR